MLVPTGGAAGPGWAWRRGLETHLHRHDLVAGLVHHLVDGAVRPAADLAQVLQVLGGEVPVLLRDLQLPRRLDAVRSQPLANRKGNKNQELRRRFGQRDPRGRRPYSHVGVLEGRTRRVEREPRHGFDRGVSKV